MLSHQSKNLNQLIAGECWVSVEEKCLLRPQQAKNWSSHAGFFDGINTSRILPIHLCCALQPPVQAVDALISAYPKGVMAPESHFGRLPLHIACMKNASVDVIWKLLNYYPKSVRIQDSLGRVPLHYACSNNAPLNVIEALLLTCKATAQCQDYDDWLPLHVATSMGASRKIVDKLIEAYPQGVNAQTCMGTRPKVGNSSRMRAILISKNLVTHADTKEEKEARKKEHKFIFQKGPEISRAVPA